MIYNNLDTLIAEAMKSKDTTRLNVLKQIKSVLVTEEKNGTTITEESELRLLNKIAKAHKESIDEFEKAGRNDLASEEMAELRILKEFMPEEVSEDVIIDYIHSCLTLHLSTMPTDYRVSMKDMKPVMGLVKTKYPTVDGKLVQSVIKSYM